MAIKDDELTRKERREEARAKREEVERRHAAAAARRRRMTWIGGGAAVVIAAVVIAVAAGSGGGSHKSGAPSATASGATTGVQVTPAPWAPEYNYLPNRINAMNLPTQSDTIFHIHAMLRVYVNGKQIPVPSQIGIDPQGQYLAPLHTHDASGIMHLEASQVYPFTLGQFLDIWGVKFTDTQIGSYVPNGTSTLGVYANGKKLADPVNYVMKPHDLIVIGYGPPGSYPTSYKASFPAGE